MVEEQIPMVKILPHNSLAIDKHLQLVSANYFLHQMIAFQKLKNTFYFI